jgi:4-hydroxybenzoate polyprenyltransferase
MKKIIKVLRPKHWAKNLLIFVIPLLSKSLEINDIGVYTIYFLTLSLFISGTYIINDLVDLESDRKHPIKKYRPIASGKLTVDNAKKLSFVLLVSTLSISLTLEFIFTSFLLIYLLLTVLYSYYFKFIKYFDLFYLTTFFIHRILLGAFLFNAEFTFIFILFTFFSTGTISIAKKYSIMNGVTAEDSKIKSSLNENYKKDTLFTLFLIFVIVTNAIFVIWIFSENYIYNPSIINKISAVAFLAIFLFYFYKFTETFETEDIIELVFKKRQLFISSLVFVLLLLYGLKQTN